MSLPKEIYLLRQERKAYWLTSQSQTFNSLEEVFSTKDKQIEWEQADFEEEDLICEFVEVVDALNGEVLCKLNEEVLCELNKYIR